MSSIDVHINKCLQSEALEADWCALYAQSDANFFLSWEWIGSWLSSVSQHADLLLISATLDNELVGLGIVCRKQTFALRVIPQQSLLLHKTGEHHLDQSWIEYNDFLLHKTHQAAVRMAMAQALLDTQKWQDIVVGASESKAFTPFKLLGLQQKTIWQSHSYQVDLDWLRTRNTAYLETLSKNTRYQIRRSLRAYGVFGEVNITRANSVSQALGWFTLAGPLHIKRWQKTKVGSGFINQNFVDFHHELIRNSFEQGKIDILQIKAGEHLICYLYNFIQDDEVKFYLSANNFSENDKTLKPGLVSHYLAIEYYLNKGMRTYDFMAGESQYKRSLASSAVPIYLNRYSRPTLINKLETKLRHLKKRLRKYHITSTDDTDARFVISGGTQSSGTKPQYSNAKLLFCQIKNGVFSVQTSVDYKPKPSQQASDTNVVFKGASVDNDKLYVVTETELLIYDCKTQTLLESISDPSFNDLHHVMVNDGKYFIVNTGQDAITIVQGENITHQHLARHSELNRITPNIDYRQQASTKPHLLHPNYCFMLNDKCWVTRCDTMDAVSLEVPHERLLIGTDLVHDGVVFKQQLFFTTVNGCIKIFDTQRKELLHSVDLHEFVPNVYGWCRGILPLKNNLVLVGLSKRRSSKSRKNIGSTNDARLLLVDVFKQELHADINMSDHGMDAIFSIVETNH